MKCKTCEASDEKSCELAFEMCIAQLKSKHNLTHDRIVVMNVKEKIDIVANRIERDTV